VKGEYVFVGMVMVEEGCGSLVWRMGDRSYSGTAGAVFMECCPVAT
jgi:hypothetical protein